MPWLPFGWQKENLVLQAPGEHCKHREDTTRMRRSCSVQRHPSNESIRESLHSTLRHHATRRGGEITNIPPPCTKLEGFTGLDSFLQRVADGISVGICRLVVAKMPEAFWKAVLLDAKIKTKLDPV